VCFANAASRDWNTLGLPIISRTAVLQPYWDSADRRVRIVVVRGPLVAGNPPRVGLMATSDPPNLSVITGPIFSRSCCGDRTEQPHPTLQCIPVRLQSNRNRVDKLAAPRIDGLCGGMRRGRGCDSGFTCKGPNPIGGIILYRNSVSSCCAVTNHW
jgi:hypothetical protein